MATAVLARGRRGRGEVDAPSSSRGPTARCPTWWPCHRRRRGGVGGGAGQAVAYPGAAVVEHRHARPYQRPAGRGASGHGAANVPCQLAGAELGPASDVRGGCRRHRPDHDDGRGRGGRVDRDKVVLTTFHRAKGLQWQTVVIIGLSAGLMPLASARRRTRSTRNAASSMWPSPAPRRSCGAAGPRAGGGVLWRSERPAVPVRGWHPSNGRSPSSTKAAAPTAAAEVSAHVVGTAAPPGRGAVGARGPVRSVRPIDPRW